MAGRLSAHFGGLRDRSEARRAGTAPVATGIRRLPDTLGTGNAERGSRLCTLASPPNLHDFEWLDDLAAVGGEAAGRLAHRWLMEWARDHGMGAGAGWTAEAAGWRLIRWLDNDGFVDPRGTIPDRLAILSRHVAFLRRRWPSAPEGMARIAALAAYVTGTLSLRGLPIRIGTEASALRDAAQALAPNGAMAARNPELLLDLLVLLLRADGALRAAGMDAPLGPVIAPIVASLRTLRHADGRLARFHGGSGAGTRLDLALAEARVRGVAQDRAMGFHRLQGGRTTVIIDAANPPGTPTAHASSLGFELTSGRRPLIVSCGSGRDFPDWARASRATASHSTVSLDGYSSSRLGRGEAFAERATVFGIAHQTIDEGTHFQGSHDGWSRHQGLTHTRNLLLSHDGRRLVGEDALAAITMAERRRFFRLNAPRFALRFHLHPDVTPDLHPAADSVTLHLRSGEVWRFTYEGPATLALEPSNLLCPGAEVPEPTQQIVLSGLVAETQARIGWTLAKAQDTPLAIRDLDRNDEGDDE